MKYLKLFEEFKFDSTRHLTSTDTEDENKVKEFVNKFNLSEIILDIWKTAKDNFNNYPIKMTPNEIIYISNDACQILIKINGEDVKITKFKKLKTDNGYKDHEIHNSEYSHDTFKQLMNKKETQEEPEINTQPVKKSRLIKFEPFGQPNMAA